MQFRKGAEELIKQVVVMMRFHPSSHVHCETNKGNIYIKGYALTIRCTEWEEFPIDSSHILHSKCTHQACTAASL